MRCRCLRHAADAPLRRLRGGVAEEILGVVGFRHQFHVAANIQPERVCVDQAQGGEVFEGEADRVEYGDLRVILAALGVSGEDAPQLDNGEVGRHLLDVALDARLRLVFDEHPRGAQHPGVQFGLAGAVTADAVDVPGSSMSGVMIAARVLSAVTVVTMSAPRTASAVELQRMILRSV